MKRALFDKSPCSDRIYFLGDFPTSCNSNTAGKSVVGLSAWLETPVLRKSMADVTQCKIHSQIQVSPTAWETLQQTEIVLCRTSGLATSLTRTPRTHLTFLTPGQSFLAKQVTLVFIFQYFFHFLALTTLER